MPTSYTTMIDAAEISDILKYLIKYLFVNEVFFKVYYIYTLYFIIYRNNIDNQLLELNTKTVILTVNAHGFFNNSGYYFYYNHMHII